MYVPYTFVSIVFAGVASRISSYCKVLHCAPALELTRRRNIHDEEVYYHDRITGSSFDLLGAYQVCSTTTPSVWRVENRTSTESYGGARIAPDVTFALCATLTTNTIYVISFCVSSFQGIPGRSGSLSVG